MFKLIVEQGEKRNEAFALHAGDNLLGRSRKAEICFQAADVSAEQARFTVAGREVRIANLSRHGTWVDERKLEGAEALPINPGQTIRFGKDQRYVLRMTAENDPADLPIMDPMAPVTAVGETAAPAATVARDNRARFDPGRQGETEMPSPEETKEPDRQRDFPTNSGPSANPAQSQTVTRSSQDPGLGWRAKASAALDKELDRETNGDDNADETRVQQTRAVPPEVLAGRVRSELKNRRRRILLGVSAAVVFLILLFWLMPKPQPATRLDWDESYSDQIVSGQGKGYRLLFPNNGTARPNNSNGYTIWLGPKHDVPLVITFQEDARDKWALQESADTMKEWMSGYTNRLFGQPLSFLAGAQSGVRVWSVDYSYTHPEQGNRMLGQAYLFTDGRRRVIQTTEIQERHRTRAEKFLNVYFYLKFMEDFDESHWEGQKPGGVSVPILLRQIAKDLEVETPSTWANIGQQIRAVLAQAVKENRPEEEKRALELLVRLRKQQERWYNGQQLLWQGQNRHQGALLARQARMVFSDPDDKRYEEVRKW